MLVSGGVGAVAFHIFLLSNSLYLQHGMNFHHLSMLGEVFITHGEVQKLQLSHLPYPLVSIAGDWNSSLWKYIWCRCSMFAKFIYRTSQISEGSLLEKAMLPFVGRSVSRKPFFKYRILKNKLVGGWTNPFEKYARQNGFIFPNFRGEHSKNIWVATTQ